MAGRTPTPASSVPIHRARSYRKELGGETKVEFKLKLRALQDWYADQMRPLGLSRGVSKAITGAVGRTHQEYRRIRRGRMLRDGTL